MLALVARAASLRSVGRDVISLALGEPDCDTPTHIQEAAFIAMRNGDTHYTASDGTKALKEAIRRKFERENSLTFALNEISVGSGAKQVIYNALAATVDEGDEVIVPLPYYPSYVEITRLVGGEPILVHTQPQNGFKLTPELLERAITTRTKWLILNSPSNPTGTAYSAGELRALAEVLGRHPQVWILADDIYEHLLFADQPFATLAAVDSRLKARTLTVNGVSKAYCMTGWRIGYGAGPAALIASMATIQSQITSCPSSISQAAACAALDGPAGVIDRLRSTFRFRRDLVTTELNRIRGISCAVPDGAFYVFPNCSRVLGRYSPAGRELVTDVDLAHYLLEDAGVAVVPGSDFGMPGHFRISYAADEALLRESVKRIDLALSALHGDSS
ncbi:pyridoxal phosphate-dependent aminotransferase [Bradyrhizobium macuxiense]